MPETSGELPSAQDVQASTRATEEATAQARAVRVGVRIAIGALVFSAASSIFVWSHSGRAIKQAKHDAVAQAAIASAEADRKFCASYGIIIEGYRSSGRPQTPAGLGLLASFEKVYTDLNCEPPLPPLPPLPTPSPSR